MDCTLKIQDKEAKDEQCKTKELKKFGVKISFKTLPFAME